MPIYIVEQTFPEGLPNVMSANEVVSRRSAAESIRDDDVTCVKSFVSVNGRRAFCLYEAPSPEAVRKTALENALPVDRITQVTVLDLSEGRRADELTESSGPENKIEQSGRRIK